MASKGSLLETLQFVVQVFGRRVNFFGGGYLRLAPIFLIKWGISKFQKAGRPVVIYVHPREVDPSVMSTILCLFEGAFTTEKSRFLPAVEMTFLD
jgi:hypothetical protein